MDEFNDSADIFANSSAETVTESQNVNKSFDAAEDMDFSQNTCDFPTTSHYMNLMGCQSFSLQNLLLSPDGQLSGDDFSRRYCPFCPEDCSLDSLLKDHIRKTHPLELNSVLRCKSKINFYPCPFCSGKFYIKELLPRHIIKKHDLSIVSVFNNNSLKDSHLNCQFCKHKVLSKHFKLLIVHIEKKHYREFEFYIYRKYSNVALSCEDLADLDSESRLTNQIVTPGLSRKMSQMTTGFQDDKVIYSRRPMLVKSILKGSNVNFSPSELYFSELSEASDEGEADHSALCKRPARRRLRFNLPGDENNFKLKFAFKKKENKLLKKLKMLSNKKSDDMVPLRETPKKSPVRRLENEIYQFECGNCGQQFAKNNCLRDHVKAVHGSWTLQPQYGCATCSFKCYRNVNLVRHVFRHSPRCLKPKSQPSNQF